MEETKGTFRPGDVVLLLNDISGLLEPLPTEARERLIQSGVHYSAMLPLEYKPSAPYLALYEYAMTHFADETAEAVATVAEKIYRAKGDRVVLVSLARAGTPVGILIKRCLRARYGFDAPHYTMSIVRGRGLDPVAMKQLLRDHAAGDIQFIDGWTGKGAILDELHAAAREFMGEQDKRQLLAVLADPAHITERCGTHADIPIASAFLNAPVCGMMSRTVIRPGIGPAELHGVAFYPAQPGEDKTYDFIDRITERVGVVDRITERVGVVDRTTERVDAAAYVCAGESRCYESPWYSGMDEVRTLAAAFGVQDLHFIKPGIGEATRVLLRRVPDMVLVAQGAPPRHVAHLIQLAAEKRVPVVYHPLRRYKACGIIKTLAPDV